MSYYGYSLFINRPYKEVVPSEVDFDHFRSNCSQNSKICLGCGISSLDSVSCTDCNFFLTETTKNNPKFSNGVWWYYTPSISIGYADKSTINQNNADKEDPNSDKRISWPFGNGFRCGSKFYPAYHRKFIFIKW